LISKATSVVCFGDIDLLARNGSLKVYEMHT